MSLHWLMAALIILNLAIGLAFDDMERPIRAVALGYHKSIDVTVLLLTLVRIVWRLTHRVPDLPEAMAAGLKLAARSAYALLYLTMLAVPLAGYLMTSAAGKGFSYFGLFPFPLIGGFDGMGEAARKALAHNFGAAHSLMAWGMLGLVVLHIAAAFFHRLVLRDEVFWRMLPGR